MTDFNFYSETYCGSLIPADAWDAVCRDAEAQMNRYERIYHVSYPQTGSRNMAVCAMAEALYEFAQLQDAGGAVQSVSVGNVSENRAAVAARRFKSRIARAPRRQADVRDRSGSFRHPRYSARTRARSSGVSTPGPGACGVTCTAMRWPCQSARSCSSASQRSMGAGARRGKPRRKPAR